MLCLTWGLRTTRGRQKQLTEHRLTVNQCVSTPQPVSGQRLLSWSQLQQCLKLICLTWWWSRKHKMLLEAAEDWLLFYFFWNRLRDETMRQQLCQASPAPGAAVCVTVFEPWPPLDLAHFLRYRELRPATPDMEVRGCLYGNWPGVNRLVMWQGTNKCFLLFFFSSFPCIRCEKNIWTFLNFVNRKGFYYLLQRRVIWVIYL